MTAVTQPFADAGFETSVTFSGFPNITATQATPPQTSLVGLGWVWFSRCEGTVTFTSGSVSCSAGSFDDTNSVPVDAPSAVGIRVPLNNIVDVTFEKAGSYALYYRPDSVAFSDETFQSSLASVITVSGMWWVAL